MNKSLSSKLKADLVRNAKLIPEHQQMLADVLNRHDGEKASQVKPA